MTTDEIKCQANLIRKKNSQKVVLRVQLPLRTLTAIKEALAQKPVGQNHLCRFSLVL